MTDEPESTDPEREGSGQEGNSTPGGQIPGGAEQNAEVSRAGGGKGEAVTEQAVERAVKRELRLPEWIMALFTIAIFCSAVAQCLEMKAGGVDTHQLAVAASGQEVAAASAASAAASQAEIMSGMATIQSAQLSSLNASVSAAQAAADATKAQVTLMQANQRPWVYAAAVVPAGRIVLAEDQYAVPLKITIKNTGHLPAFYAIAKTSATIITPGRSATLIKNVICDDYRHTQTKTGSGDTIFADQSITHEGFTSDEYPAIAKGDWDASGSGRLIIVFGCVDYQFPASPGHHQSRFAFAVGRAADQGELARLAMLPDDPTTVDIRLKPITIGGAQSPD